jgi:hypothetical protein
MPSGFNIETIETYSKWSNMLQLAFGLLSILAYVSVNVIQTRFFPIQARADPTNACLPPHFFALPPILLLSSILLAPLSQAKWKGEKESAKKGGSRGAGQGREREVE